MCGSFWITRKGRQSQYELFFDWSKIDKIIREWLKANELIPEFLKVDAPIVLLEHFAAGLGLPAFATGIACLLVCRKSKLERKNQRLKAEIVVLLAAFLSILAYAVYESWHEALQLTLAKRSNFGQFLADKCIPAETITAFGTCSKNYIVMVQQQLVADGLGMLTFICVFFALLYRFKRDEPASYPSIQRTNKGRFRHSLLGSIQKKKKIVR